MERDSQEELKSGGSEQRRGVLKTLSQTGFEECMKAILDRNPGTDQNLPVWGWYWKQDKLTKKVGSKYHHKRGAKFTQLPENSLLSGASTASGVR